MKIPLFDIDKTLLQGGNQAHRQSFDYALNSVYQLPDASINEIKVDGKIDTQILLEVARLHNVPESMLTTKIPEAVKAMEIYYFQHQDEGETRVLKGVKNLLQTLKDKKIPCGLLTGNVESIGWDKIEKAGLKDYFSFGAFGSLAYKRVDLITVAQDRAEIILNQKFKPTDFFIVGDSPLDIACAKSGGIQVIAVAQGDFSQEELRAAGADLTLESLEEIDKFLSFIQIFT
jgi:phosphoglycolate phosphatase